MSGANDDTTGGSVSRIFAMRLACVVASNARRPVAISYSEGAQREDVGARVRGGPAPVRAPCTAACRRGSPRRVRSWRRRQHRELLPGSADGVLREAEIEQLRAGRGEHHVPRLQIAMDDAEPVRGLERIRDFNAEPEDLAQWQRAACQTGGQRLPVEQFEHQILDVVLAADVVQARRCARG